MKDEIKDSWPPTAVLSTPLALLELLVDTLLVYGVLGDILTSIVSSSHFWKRSEARDMTIWVPTLPSPILLYSPLLSSLLPSLPYLLYPSPSLRLPSSTLLSPSALSLLPSPSLHSLLYPPALSPHSVSSALPTTSTSSSTLPAVFTLSPPSPPAPPLSGTSPHLTPHG